MPSTPITPIIVSKDDILTELRKDSKTRCTFGEWLTILPSAAQDAIAEGCSDPDVQLAAIIRYARKNGYAGGDTTIKTHRAGTCLCTAVQK